MADELDALRKASEGLLYPSESDEPFDVFTWPTGSSAKDVLASKHEGKVDEASFDEFFAELADSEDAGRFAKLKEVITATLRDVRVFRVGATNVDIYIVGKSASGHLSGLHTTSIET